jgi:MATE family multidrug resistance protein
MNLVQTIKFEAQSLIKLATPIILALILTCSMSVIDTVMAGQVSAQDLAAVSIGTAIWNLLFLTMNAILMALTPQIAKLHGEKKFSEMLEWMRAGRWYAMGITALFLIIGQFGLAAIPLLGATPETTILAENYLSFVMIGLPAVALFQIHRSFSEGNHVSRHVLIVTILAVMLNIPLNYLFIHGVTIFEEQTLIPALGGAGCGLASAIIFWLSFVTLSNIQKKDKQLLTCVNQNKSISLNKIQIGWQRPPNFQLIAIRLSTVGFPIGLAILAEVSVFTYIPLVIAHLGEIQVAAHQIALNVCSLMFMVPLGLSQAITVRTGYQLGKGSPELAQIVSRTGISIAFLFGLCSMSLIMLNSSIIPPLYTTDENVISLASSLLILAAIFQLTDTVQITAAGSLRGYQLTTVPMLLTIIAFWGVAIPAGYLLGLESEARTALEHWLQTINGPELPAPMGVTAFWYALITGLSTNGLLQVSYLLYVQCSKK